MPRKHHKKRNHSKKESVIEGFKRLEITEKKEPKTSEGQINKGDTRRKRYLKRCASENSLKTNAESTHLLSRSEPCLHEAISLEREIPIPRRKHKKLRFSHEVIVMLYQNNKPTIRRIQPLADERDQQRRSYRNRSLKRPIDTMF